MRYKLIISYDGTPFHGWQIQPNGISIQALIENALHTVLRMTTPIVGAGRTDAGVHALNQAAHFDSSIEMNLYRLQGSLNGLLPKEIRILEIEQVEENFHARYSALSKVYSYHLNLEQVLLPFYRNYVWHIRSSLDIGLMRVAANHFLGTHNFSSYANEAQAGVAAHDPVRTIMRLEFIPEPGGLAIEMEADGFLYKMVRNIIGTLVECGRKKLSPSQIPAILKAEDRRKAGLCAPAQGLFLASVKYRV